MFGNDNTYRVYTKKKEDAANEHNSSNLSMLNGSTFENMLTTDLEKLDADKIAENVYLRNEQRTMKCTESNDYIALIHTISMGIYCLNLMNQIRALITVRWSEIKPSEHAQIHKFYESVYKSVDKMIRTVEDLLIDLEIGRQAASPTTLEQLTIKETDKIYVNNAIPSETDFYLVQQTFELTCVISKRLLNNIINLCIDTFDLPYQYLMHHINLAYSFKRNSISQYIENNLIISSDREQLKKLIGKRKELLHKRAYEKLSKYIVFTESILSIEKLVTEIKYQHEYFERFQQINKSYNLSNSNAESVGSDIIEVKLQPKLKAPLKGILKNSNPAAHVGSVKAVNNTYKKTTMAKKVKSNRTINKLPINPKVPNYASKRIATKQQVATGIKTKLPDPHSKLANNSTVKKNTIGTSNKQNVTKTKLSTTKINQVASTKKTSIMNRVGNDPKLMPVQTTNVNNNLSKNQLQSKKAAYLSPNTTKKEYLTKSQEDNKQSDWETLSENTFYDAAYGEQYVEFNPAVIHSSRLDISKYKLLGNNLPVKNSYNTEIASSTENEQEIPNIETVEILETAKEILDKNHHIIESLSNTNNITLSHPKTAVTLRKITLNNEGKLTTTYNKKNSTSSAIAVGKHNANLSKETNIDYPKKNINGALLNTSNNNNLKDTQFLSVLHSDESNTFTSQLNDKFDTRDIMDDVTILTENNVSNNTNESINGQNKNHTARKTNMSVTVSNLSSNEHINVKPISGRLEPKVMEKSINMKEIIETFDDKLKNKKANDHAKYNHIIGKSFENILYKALDNEDNSNTEHKSYVKVKDIAERYDKYKSKIAYE